MVGVNSDGKTVLKYKVSDFQVSSVTNWKNGYVVTDVEGHLYYINAEDGHVEWKHHLGHDASGIFAGPVTTKDKFALLSSRNRLYVFQ